jgi:plastocyanin
MRRVMLLAAALACACGSKDKGATTDTTAAAAPGAATPTASAPAGNASVSGVVHFTGTAPKNPTIDMSQESTCQAKYSGPPTDPQYVVNGGNLGNVFVYVKSGLPAGATYPVPATAVTIDQNGCLYHPRVFGIQVGQKLEIKNSDNVLHNIKAVPAKNRGFNISQPSAGMTTTRTFSTEEEMVPLQCNVHGWMNAYVGVLPHPFFATSGPDGSFKITGLPPGTYDIEAWHEKLGTQHASVTVGAGEAKTADFTFGPKA